MKTVTGRIISATPYSLTKAAKLLSKFASASDNGASQDVSAYLQRASAAFTELKSLHREINSSSLAEKKPRSDVSRDPNPTGESDGRAKGIDDSVENAGKIRDRRIETVSDGESVHDRKLDEIKEDKKEKKKKEENVVVDEQMSEERKEKKKKKKKKSKKSKEEDVVVVVEKVKEEYEEEQRNEERKEQKKKKRKSDGKIGSEEKKSKKRKKSKEIDA